ncbi:hypothetical protein Q7P37_008977 [Cladosporium fusiforme]
MDMTPAAPNGYGAANASLYSSSKGSAISDSARHSNAETTNTTILMKAMTGAEAISHQAANSRPCSRSEASRASLCTCAGLDLISH